MWQQYSSRNIMSVNNVQIHFEDIEPGEIPSINYSKYIKKLIKNEGHVCGEISIILCSDKYLLNINKEYLGHNYFTDIVTFDYVENETINGDLFISTDRVKENAKLFKVDFVNELCRVVFHGILHLAGYKDKTEEEQKRMREKENYYLQRFETGINNDR